MLALILGLLLQAAETPLAATPSVVAGPDWQRRPGGDDVLRYYPEAAQRRNLSGRATISCRVAAAGLLENCTVVEESPIGEGFGDAALRMAPLFKMRPMNKDGVPVDGGTVKIPIRFQLPGANVDPITGLSLCYGVTAAAVEKDPANLEATNAYGFFAAQLAIRSAQAHTPPAMFEARLSYARTQALSGEKNPNVRVSLNQCLGFVPKPPSPKSEAAPKP